MRLHSTIDIYAGGPGSGCHGPNCGRKAKASVAEVRRLTRNGRMSGWGSFKHALMNKLGIPVIQFDKWDVPQEWIDAYKKFYHR